MVYWSGGCVHPRHLPSDQRRHEKERPRAMAVVAVAAVEVGLVDIAKEL